MDLELLDDTLAELGEPPFRARQVWAWAARGRRAATTEMTDLPPALRAALAERVPFSTLTLEHEAHAADGTVKALFSTADGRPVEAVLMRYRDGRRSVCVSSQSGCPLTCTFCATGAMRFGRNLTASEILDQVLHFRRIERVDHLVFMGMGEPMMNLDARARAPASGCPTLGITHRRTGDLDGRLGPRHRARSPSPTCRSGSRSRCTPPTTRCARELMPVNDRYPLAEVLAACEALLRAQAPPGVRRVRDARRRQRPLRAGASRSRELLDPRVYKVNLIPYNPTGAPTKAPAARRSRRSTRRSRSTACAPRCASRAAATSTPPAGSSRRRPPA